MNFLSEEEMNVQTLEFRMSKLFPYARELLSLAMDEVNINNTVLFMKLRNLEDALIYKESTFKKLMILMKESDDYEDKIIPRGRPSCSIKRELKMMKFEEDTIKEMRSNLVSNYLIKQESRMNEKELKQEMFKFDNNSEHMQQEIKQHTLDNTMNIFSNKDIEGYIISSDTASNKSIQEENKQRGIDESNKQINREFIIDNLEEINSEFKSEANFSVKSKEIKISKSSLSKCDYSNISQEFINIEKINTPTFKGVQETIDICDKTSCDPLSQYYELPPGEILLFENSQNSNVSVKSSNALVKKKSKSRLKAISKSRSRQRPKSRSGLRRKSARVRNSVSSKSSDKSKNERTICFQCKDQIKNLDKFVEANCGHKVHPKCLIKEISRKVNCLSSRVRFSSVKK